RRANEGERDEVDSRLERPVEVVHVLPRQGRDRQRDTREGDAPVRRDSAADDDDAPGTSTIDVVNTKADKTVVDEHLVSRFQHVADDRRSHRELAVSTPLLSANGDLVAGVENKRLRELP